MSRILIIDDDKMVCDILVTFVRSLGHEADQALNLVHGFEKLADEAFDLVLLDVRLPDGDGLEAIPKIKNAPSSPEIIIITGEGSPDGAQLAIESGSWDYLQKPLSTQKVSLSLTRALQYRQGKTTSGNLLLLQRDAIIGSSPLVKECLEQVARAASVTTNVLITGETGTGKELFARAIHDNSPRSFQPLVVVDCSVLSETLAESILFGHVKGAFTGADRKTGGLIRAADGGTLFLDEVGELPFTIQSAFLRVLQERRFRPVGGKDEVVSDFRLIAATNRDLNQMVYDGRFRNDLLYRLRSLVIHLPPLRQHTTDIMDLILHFIAKFTERNRIGMKGISPEFYEALHKYSWPGNVRELANALETALVSAKDEPTLHPIHLPVEIRAELVRASISPGLPKPEEPAVAARKSEPIPPLREVIDAVTRKYLEDLIRHTDGDINEICGISGISRANIYARFKKYRITRRN
jgi:two-component system, NtrC family, response regulator